ncbi:J domain-containing protein [Nocardioides sp. MH1]|uniref:J domain-containing protein n=1 Tax=Nocardioides sp. MH1 TaxID=3242490 RepID=UPI00351FF65C
MSISLYDLLDVDETASADEVKAAWKAAIADLDPTDRRFRAYNDAAAVLLDEDKRTAYDAELASARDAEAEADEAEEAPIAERADVREPVEVRAPDEVREPADVHEPVAVTEPVPAEPTVAPPPVAPPPVADAEPAPVVDAQQGGVPTWSLLVAAGVAVLALALMVVVLAWPGSLGDDSPKKQETGESSSEEAGREAVAAASAAVPAVLGYDYRTLDADFAEAEKYLTDDFAAQRTDLFDQKTDAGTTLRDQVVSEKVVVTAVVRGTGLTRVSPEGDRATVVVYVDQESQKGRSEPRPLQMWATLSMVEDHGDWLIDDICTESDCS